MRGKDNVLVGLPYRMSPLQHWHVIFNLEGHHSLSGTCNSIHKVYEHSFLPPTFLHVVKCRLCGYRFRHHVPQNVASHEQSIGCTKDRFISWKLKRRYMLIMLSNDLRYIGHKAKPKCSCSPQLARSSACVHQSTRHVFLLRNRRNAAANQCA